MKRRQRICSTALAGAFAALTFACTPEHDPADVEPVDMPEPGGDVVTMREGFSFPESAVYDPEQDVYFISNIHGPPMAKDDNGYITRVDAETGDIDIKWIDGAREDVTLHGPRGLSIAGDLLYAADVDSLRWFDRNTGAQRGVAAIPNSIFVNDIFALPDGTVYLTDSGMPGSTEGDPANPRDAVYRISSGRDVEQIASGDDLNRPDGVWVREGGEVWVTAFGSKEVYRLENGKKADVQQVPRGILDGLIWLDNGAFLVSSWDGNGIYYGRLGGPFERIIGDINSPADFGLDTRRNLLIIPHLDESVVSIHPLGGLNVKQD